MSITPNLVFFNKEGFPYNFKLNDGIWTGKIFFDPNSSDTFKSLSIYTLESVKPIEYTDTFDIINMEIYNESGFTISNGNMVDEIVTNIISVNDSPDFHSKWIYGNNFHRKFPKGTIISFNGDANPNATNGEQDFAENQGLYYTVVSSIINAIMIITNTNNDPNIYEFDFDPNLNISINSHGCISILDGEFETLYTNFNVLNGEKVSLFGTRLNDGVYQILDTGYTQTNIFDFNLSGITNFNDTINVDLTLYTERPLLYRGNIDVSYDGINLYFNFLNGRNSNLVVGSKFICEDDNWNHLLNSNEYEIINIVTEENVGTFNDMSFSHNTYEQDDGQMTTDYILTISGVSNIQIGWDIRFDSGVTSQLNERLVKRVIDIKQNDTFSDIYLDGFVSDESGVTYTITKLLRPREQNTVVVQPSIDYSEYNGPAKVMSITNKFRYSQQLVLTGTSINQEIENSIDIFIQKFGLSLEFNGIDVYRKDQIIIFEGRYGGHAPYFDIDLLINNNPISIEQNYSDSNGVSKIYNLILNNNTNRYERYNMSQNFAQSYFADITFNLFDDSQDFGFQLTINGIQYYIPFNDLSGSTSKTYETILDFIDKFGNVFYNNGIDLLSNRIEVSPGIFEEHLYISAHEPNIEIWELSVKVNKFSSYNIVNVIPTRSMMVTANKLISYTPNLIDFQFSTGMVISVNGSNFPLNNKEFNIIGLTNDTIELSYQGAMYSESGITLDIISREYLRRPRETNDKDIYYRFRWEDDTNKNIFLYDLSGENLKPWGNNPLYAYKGVKPLNANRDLLFLNKYPNKKIEDIYKPEKQQTIFEQLEFKLQRFSDVDATILPNPIQTFIGYNNTIDSVDQRNLIIERVDNIVFRGNTSGVPLYFNFYNDTVTMISGNTSFLDMGFRANRYIRIKMDDNKPYTQLVFENYLDYKILDVTNSTIKIDGKLSTFSTLNQNFTYEFLQLPERIGFIRLYGETEDEDERLESNMKLFGIPLTEEDEFIFEQSDIKDDGIDYRLLNRKRKEMMSVYPDIFNYVGSYRAILNSINFFGYDDVQLTEYYRNINPQSPYFRKMKRVVVPDLLDRQVEGWSYSEKIPNRLEYVKTSLMNLTYRITDEEGNNTYLFTLKEVQVKLNGLKNWLRRNVVPVNSNIRDITGVSEVVGTNWRRFDTGTNFTKNVVSQKNEAVNINYTATKNYNDNWLISSRFYTISGESPKYWKLKILTFKKDLITGRLYPQQRYDDMRTDLSNFNFSINWDGSAPDESDYDRYFYVETTSYNDNGVGKTINKMYRLEDGMTFYFDEFKNYVLINNNFKYKTFPYVQNLENVYIIDEDGNFWVIDKEIQTNRDLKLI